MTDAPTPDAEPTPDVEPVETPAPVLRVITPSATPEEVAAIVAVLSAMGGGEPAPPPRRPEWSAPARMHRTPLAAGPGGWRSSGLPR